MNREEAATLLNLNAEATATDVRSHFQELYSDYQVRLTNAPTAALKKAYQKNLEDLRQACEVLCPGFVFDSDGDLPSAQPVRPSPVPPLSAGQVSSRTKATETQAPKVESRGLPKSTLFVGVLAAVLAAAASLFAIKWMALLNLRDALRGTTDVQLSALSRIPDDANDIRKSLGLLQNGTFQVCNESSDVIKITLLGVTYRDREDKLKTFNKSFYDWEGWDVPRGSRKTFQFKKDGNTVWDGSVLFYAVNLIHKGNEYFVAGPWRDVKDGCLQFTFQ
jgi:hypothetical protein